MNLIFDILVDKVIVTIAIFPKKHIIHNSNTKAIVGLKIPTIATNKIMTYLGSLNIKLLPVLQWLRLKGKTGFSFKGSISFT